MKVLIWQTAFLGDVVLTSPLIEAVRRHLKPKVITFVGRPFIKDLFKGWNLNLLPFSKGFLESFKMLTLIRKHDVAIVPHRSLRSALIIFASGIPIRVGFDRSEFPFAFNKRVKHRWDIHEVYRNLELLKPLGIDEVNPKLSLPLSSGEKKEILSKFSLEEGSYMVINPFSNFPLKEWEISNWLKLINYIRDIRIVITGAPSDKKRSYAFKGFENVVNLTGKTNLRDLMGILAGARVLLSVDSSPIHIASAFGTPAVTLYTATSPRYGFYPLFGDYLENPAPCSPCSPNPKRCRLGTLECKKSIRPEAVLKVLEKFL